MRSIGVAVAALTSWSLAGCVRTGDCGQPPTANGRSNELMFALELGHDMSEGLSQEILIPERVDSSRVDTWRFTDPFRTTNEPCFEPFVVDFADTTIDVVGDDVLEIVGVGRIGNDYVVTVRCAPGPYPVETQLAADGVIRTTQRQGSLWVRILAGIEVRYEDRYGVRCWQADEMSLHPEKTTLVVGDTSRIWHSLRTHWEHELSSGEVQTIAQELVGYGYIVRGTLPPIEAEQDFGDFLAVTAVRVGQDATIAAGTLEKTVALTVIE